MSTGIPLDSRLDLVHELFLAVGQPGSRAMNHDTSIRDLLYLTRSILFDREPYGITMRQILCQEMKKTPIWSRVLPFLRHGEMTCARKGCNCLPICHPNNGACSGLHTDWSQPGPGVKTPCQCPGFIQRVLI